MAAEVYLFKIDNGRPVSMAGVAHRLKIILLKKLAVCHSSPGTTPREEAEHVAAIHDHHDEGRDPHRNHDREYEVPEPGVAYPVGPPRLIPMLTTISATKRMAVPLWAIPVFPVTEKMPNSQFVEMPVSRAIGCRRELGLVRL